ncbi:MAG TPA: hypothetical protein VIL46_04440, partial [Gemmataceae bacterium]
MRRTILSLAALGLAGLAGAAEARAQYPYGYGPYPYDGGYRYHGSYYPHGAFRGYPYGTRYFGGFPYARGYYRDGYIDPRADRLGRLAQFGLRFGVPLIGRLLRDDPVRDYYEDIE